MVPDELSRTLREMGLMIDYMYPIKFAESRHFLETLHVSVHIVVFTLVI